MNVVDQAVSILKAGGLVAIPTETVYGLGADARNPQALEKIFMAKQRPINHPLIVHLGDIKQLSDWAREIPDSAWQLANAFWPGPLTIILKKAPDVLDLITGQQDTIALRIPSHPVALSLLQLFGGGIAAPSANRFGRISPTTATAVREELGDAVELILEGGECEVGLESTIVDLSGGIPTVLRPGMISSQDIAFVLKTEVLSSQTDSPRVSGSLESHYAPQTQMVLIPSDQIPAYLQTLSNEELPVVVLLTKALPVRNTNIELLVMPTDAKNYAHHLYQTLRDLDKKSYKKIIVEEVPLDGQWDAVRDRLKRASY
jgi:L-threonylcarbamoyladenylate synthase